MRRWAIAALVAVLAAAAAGVAVHRAPDRTATARFTSATGVYPGSAVRVLGVRIGTVTKVTPEGPDVRVELTYERRYRLPADAIAAIVSPALAGDRFVQLAPAYQAGAALPDRAAIPLERTATPAEADDIYRGLASLTAALGPGGANRTGSLSRLVKTGAANLGGQGAELNKAITGLAAVAGTAADGKDDLASTIRNLQRFAAVLAASDSRIREFNASLATVSAQLDGEKAALAASIRALSLALAQLAAFVRENKETLVTDVRGLTQLSGILARQKQALGTFLDLAPAGLANLRDAYDPATRSLAIRDRGLSTADPAVVVCAALANLRTVPGECTALAGQLAHAGTLPGALKPLVGRVAGIPPAAGADRSLGGILKAVP